MTCVLRSRRDKPAPPAPLVRVVRVHQQRAVRIRLYGGADDALERVGLAALTRREPDRAMTLDGSCGHLTLRPRDVAPLARALSTLAAELEVR